MEPPVETVPAIDAARVRVPASRRRQHLWAAAAVLLVGCGVVGSVLAGGAVARNYSDRSLRTFQRSSAGVASTFQLAIEHDNDVVVDAGGVLADPHVTQTEFVEWASAVRMFHRYPEIAAVGLVVMVKPAELATFAARSVLDPAGSLGRDGAFAVIPAGSRPFYCLPAAVVSRSAAAEPPAGVDLCPTPARSAQFLAGRDSGQGLYVPVSAAGQTFLTIQTPIYRDGVTPATVAGRRTAFIGLVATRLDPSVILARVVQGQAGMSVSIHYQAGDQDVTFSTGHATAGAQSATIDLHNGWTVQTSAVIDEGSIASGGALATLLAGIVVSVLLGVLLFVLATGRERARRQLEQRTGQLHHQALHDALTGLPNRALVMDRIEQMLVRDRRRRTTGAVLFLDLDDFKNVNDTLGHGAGDRLLIAVAARLASTLRDEDTIGRMGGDEFVVIVDGSSGDAALDSVAERILDAMRQPFDLDDTSMPLIVNISIGIASGDRDNAGELLRDADIALYQAKGAGKNRFEIFEAHMHTAMSRRTDLEFDLRSALTRNEYRLVYQPIYNLDDLSVVGVEALLRWDHPTRGAIAPDEFVPILEQTGQIGEVGRWVLHQACQQMATWHAKGDTLDISVNLSGRQLDHNGITDDVRSALVDSGLPARSLIIEVTETALMHNVGATTRRLRAIRDLGVRIAVDDFGTGYSSLAYLRQFPVDSLKIDRMFTSAITTSPESRALVATLVQLGRDLGLSTLAEGVETTEEMDLLRCARVDQAQGFLMAHPLDPATLEIQFLEPTRTATPTKRA